MQLAQREDDQDAGPHPAASRLLDEERDTHREHDDHQYPRQHIDCPPPHRDILLAGNPQARDSPLMRGQGDHPIAVVRNDGRVTNAPPDEPFLVCYDYGMGGLWGVLMAPSAAAIEARYPDLHIADEPPAWMSSEELSTLGEEPLWLHDEPPQG